MKHKINYDTINDLFFSGGSYQGEARTRNTNPGYSYNVNKALDQIQKGNSSKESSTSSSKIKKSSDDNSKKKNNKVILQKKKSLHMMQL